VLLAAEVARLTVRRNKFVLGDCFGVLLLVDGTFAGVFLRPFATPVP
jgi:hypothetical protein